MLAFLLQKVHKESIPVPVNRIFFAYTKNTLEQLCARTLQSQRFVDIFCDTNGMGLLYEHHCWLKLRKFENGDQLWSLREIHANGIFFTEIDTREIQQYVADKLNCKPDIAIEEMVPNKYAELKTRRFVNTQSLHLDSVELADKDYYVVGAMYMKDPSKVVIGLDSGDAFCPTRSKILEYLYYYKQEVYPLIDNN